MADELDYVNRIPWEHRLSAPKYELTIRTTVRPYVDMQNILSTFATLFDLDTAVGQQLDFTGEWIGRTRFLTVPLDIFFSFDIPFLGFDEGLWYGPYEVSTGNVRLPDNYRILLKATVAANYWDGTIPGAYNAWNTLFAGTGFNILIQDYENMQMAIALIGQQPDTITRALFTTGELDLKPAGVTLYHILPTVYPAGVVDGVVGTPLFGFDVDNENVGGFDHGAWGYVISIE